MLAMRPAWRQAYFRSGFPNEPTTWRHFVSELHPNVLTYLAAIDAFNRNDVAAVAEHVSADFVYRIPGRSIVAGEFHGVEGFIEALARLRDESGGTIDVAPTVVLADDDNLIARVA